MKLKNMMKIGVVAAAALTFFACKNADTDFPDFDGGTKVYFAYQYPERVLCLGEQPLYDNTIDNAHGCQIFATMGGSVNGRNIVLDIAVDNSLTDNLTYDTEGTQPVKPMPSNYYKLLSNQIYYNGGLQGAVDVKFEDAFFADPEAVSGSYVIPVRIVSQTGADGILSGEAMDPEGAAPARTDAEAWSVQPKDFVLYRVRYVNPWDAEYSRRGSDVIKVNGKTLKNESASRKPADAQIEKGEIVSMTTIDMNRVNYAFSVNVKEGDELKTYACDLVFTFEGNECRISTTTEGCRASGTGRFVSKDPQQSWGNQPRSTIYADYEITFADGSTCTTSDIFVVQTRGISSQTFSPTYNK